MRLYHRSISGLTEPQVKGLGWCPGSESNRYVSFETRDFKPIVELGYVLPC
jgi:hypothetical protein